MLFRFAGVCAVALLVSAPAYAATGWYVGVSGGAYFRDSTDITTNFSSARLPGVVVPGTNHFSYATGEIAGLMLGRRMGAHLRGELELSYANYMRSGVNPSTADPRFPNLDGGRFDRQSGGVVERAGGSANIFYDFGQARSAIRPYIGIGVGGAYTHATLGAYVKPDGSTFREASSAGSDGFGLVEGGLGVRLGEHWAIVPSYRYERYFKTNGDSASIAKLGVRYAFGG